MDKECTSEGHKEVMELVHKAMLLPGYSFNGAATRLYDIIRTKYKRCQKQHNAKLVEGNPSVLLGVGWLIDTMHYS